VLTLAASCVWQGCAEAGTLPNPKIVNESKSMQEMLALALVMSGGAPGDVAAALKVAFLRYSSAQPGPGAPREI